MLMVEGDGSCVSSSLLSSSSSSSWALKWSRDVMYVLSCVCEHLEVHGSEYVSQFDDFMLSCVVGGRKLDMRRVRLSLKRCNVLSLMLSWYGRLLECVNLSFCGMGDVGFLVLCVGLRVCTGLCELDVTVNDLSSAVANELCGVLECMEGLRMIRVEWNPKLGDVGIQAVCFGLRSCSSLKEVEMGYVGMTHASLGNVAGVVERCVGSLEVLDLRSNDFREEVDDPVRGVSACDKFVDAVRKCLCLRKVTLPDRRLVCSNMVRRLQSLQAQACPPLEWISYRRRPP